MTPDPCLPVPINPILSLQAEQPLSVSFTGVSLSLHPQDVSPFLGLRPGAKPRIQIICLQRRPVFFLM